jgi:UDP-3-O-acyl-N-acetylglucosamine deacetylase
VPEVPGSWHLDLIRRMPRLDGVSLHSGREASVEFAITAGPSCFEAHGARSLINEATLVRTDHGVCVSLGEGGPQVDLVEHLAAAVGGLGLLDGLIARVVGGEPPLLDGGAALFVEALRSLGISPVSSKLEIVRSWSFSLGASQYELAPSRGTRLDVAIEFDHPAIGRQAASWEGDPDDFARRIAPARTFGFVRDAEALRAAGRAASVDLEAVVVLDERGPIAGGFRGEHEPARHKLLDLLGDLTLRGGPVRGVTRATRPGHSATHAMLDAAFRDGVIRAHDA